MAVSWRPRCSSRCAPRVCERVGLRARPPATASARDGSGRASGAEEPRSSERARTRERERARAALRARVTARRYHAQSQHARTDTARSPSAEEGAVAVAAPSPPSSSTCAARRDPASIMARAPSPPPPPRLGGFLGACAARASRTVGRTVCPSASPASSLSSASSRHDRIVVARAGWLSRTSSRPRLQRRPQAAAAAATARRPSTSARRCAWRTTGARSEERARAHRGTERWRGGGGDGGGEWRDVRVAGARDSSGKAAAGEKKHDQDQREQASFVCLRSLVVLASAGGRTRAQCDRAEGWSRVCISHSATGTRKGASAGGLAVRRDHRPAVSSPAPLGACGGGLAGPWWEIVLTKNRRDARYVPGDIRFFAQKTLNIPYTGAHPRQ